MANQGFAIIPPAVKKLWESIIEYPVHFFIKLNIHPNFFTALGLIVSMIGAYFYAVGNLHLGGLMIIAGGICDTFDGKIARKRSLASKFGAVFDSSLDRYAEFFMFFGIFIHLLKFDSPFYVASTFATYFALIGSIMVSYVRARAEGAGLECKVGMLQRAERILLIGIASLLHISILIVALWIVAIFANITAVQRIHHVRKVEKAEVENER
jgi:CDP-diacylglycerol--glycerol-3-phosphate 3-phosphatidyltransferase